MHIIQKITIVNFLFNKNYYTNLYKSLYQILNHPQIRDNLYARIIRKIIIKIFWVLLFL